MLVCSKLTFLQLCSATVCPNLVFGSTQWESNNLTILAIILIRSAKIDSETFPYAMVDVLSPLGTKDYTFLCEVYTYILKLLCLAEIMCNQMYKLCHTQPAVNSCLLTFAQEKDKYSFESNREIVYLPFCITFKSKKISGVLFFVF